MNINIHFRLHQAVKLIPKEQNIVYSYVEKKKTEKKGHSYTINLNKAKE